MSAHFVTASGTGVGKTYVTAALIRELTARGRNVRALKPVLSGFTWEEVEESDTAILLRAGGQEPTRENIEAASPWRFEAPLSPDMAAKREDTSIDFDGLVDWCRNAVSGPEEFCFIEGIGGAMVPLTENHTVRDWIGALGLPSLVVVGSYLGTLSHTLTTLEAMAEKSLPVTAVIISESEESPVPPEETAETLARFISDTPIRVAHRDDGAEGIFGLLM